MADEMVQISKADLAILERTKAMTNAAWKDPAFGAAFRKKAKELYSDIALPEDNVDPVVAPLRAEVDETKAQLKSALERLDKRDNDEKERATQTSLENALNNARQKFSLTDEGFDKMVARMKETSNFTDAEAAAAWVASTTPAPKPAGGPSWTPQDLNLYGSKTVNDDYKLLHQDTEAFFDQTVQQILTEAAA